MFYPNGIGPFPVLPAGSTAGNGSPVDLGVPMSSHTLVVVGSAGITAGAVQLQIAADYNPGNPAANPGTWVNIGSPLTATASVAVTASVANVPARFIRATVSTGITGGSVAAYLISAGQ